MQTRVARRVVVAAVLVAGLTSCGAANQGGAASTPIGSTSTPHATTTHGPTTQGTPPEDGPFQVKPLPVRPAPDAFRERAQAVAALLRSSGLLETYRKTVTLTDSRTIETGYESDELKILFSHGGFVAGPTITDDPGNGTITFDDGSTRTVRTIGARSAVELAKNELPGCQAVTKPVSAACPATIARAEKGTHSVLTNHGMATVPVWKFWATGMKTPYMVVAVDESDLSSPMQRLSASQLAGLPQVDGLISAMSLDSVSGADLTVTIRHGACDESLAAHVVELDDAVVVGATSGSAGSCTAQLAGTPATVHLTKPLGDRPVIDIVAGSPVGPLNL